MASRIDTIRVKVPDGTPAGEYPTADFDRMLHAPMIEVDQRWPLRPLTPTVTKPRDNYVPYMPTAVGGKRGFIFRFSAPVDGQGRHR